MPPLMSNHHCYIGSLGDVCRWLAPKAEALGVEIYPGFAAVEVLYDDNGAVRGIATGDMGVARDGSHKDNYTPRHGAARQIHADRRRRARLARKQLIARFRSMREPRREVRHRLEGIVGDRPRDTRGLMHSIRGWPLDNQTGGGSFLYHYGDNKVAVGFVVHLDYDNPYLSPFEEFQRFKTHPSIRPILEGGKRLAYGARAITEGGFSRCRNCVSRRRADRLRGRFRQPAAHQRQPQCDPHRHDGRRGMWLHALGAGRGQ